MSSKRFPREKSLLNVLMPRGLPGKAAKLVQDSENV